MIYIVNGTGPVKDVDYAVEMAGSNCWMLYFMNKGNARYWRGPNIADVWQRTASIAEEVYQEIMKNEFPPAFVAPGKSPPPKSDIYLVGYSRGGAAVVLVAKMLAERAIPVAGMFLFDAVRRATTFADLETVPKNVAKCYHAIRNEGVQVVMEVEERDLWKKCQQAAGFKEIEKDFLRMPAGSFEDYLRLRSSRFPQLNSLVQAWFSKSTALKNLKSAMRNSFSLGGDSSGLSVPFSNCALEHTSGTEWHLQAFAGSHGALGGVPAKSKGDREDELDIMEREASRRVWTWMSKNMLACNLRAGRA